MPAGTQSCSESCGRQRASLPHGSTARPCPWARRSCEHAFVSIKGSPHARFRRSLETGRLSVVLLAAAELQHLELDDALEVLVLMARERHPRFDRAATRWVGRLLAERPLGLADARFALILVERLPARHETLQRFARRRQVSPS